MYIVILLVGYHLLFIISFISVIREWVKMSVIMGEVQGSFIALLISIL